MNETKSQSYNVNSLVYWKSVGIAGILFGVAAFFIKIVLIHFRLQVKPTGSFFVVDLILGILIFVWLIKAFGGLFASWYYNKNSPDSVSLGRAAMIGFLTGVAVTIVGIILSLLWHWADPGMIQRRMKSDLAVVKAVQLPADQKKLIVDSIKKSFNSPAQPGRALFAGIFIYGIPNLITGMIGAKIFQKKPDNGQLTKPIARGK